MLAGDARAAATAAIVELPVVEEEPAELLPEDPPTAVAVLVVSFGTSLVTCGGDVVGVIIGGRGAGFFWRRSLAVFSAFLESEAVRLMTRVVLILRDAAEV